MLNGQRCWSASWQGHCIAHLAPRPAEILLPQLCALQQVPVEKGTPLFPLKSLILKGGYEAGVGSYQLKLHFHRALCAKPLKALKKILEAVQHEIALAHCSRKTNLLSRFEN